MHLDFTKFTNRKYGPIYGIPILVTPESTATAQELTTSAEFGSILSKQLELAIPLIIGLLLLVFDNSRTYLLLGYYATCRAVYGALSLLGEVGNEPDWIPAIIHIKEPVITLSGVFAILFVLETIKYKPKIPTKPLFLLPLLFVPNLLILKFPNYLYYHWYVIDLIIGISSVVLIFLKTFNFNFKSEEKLESLNTKNTNIKPATIILLVISCVMIFSSIDGLNIILETARPDFIDYRLTLVLPFYLIAAFIDFGSIVKYTEKLEFEAKKNASLEKELQLGAEIQKKLLPPKKQIGDFYSWNILFKPAVHVSGDWHEVGKLSFSDGTTYLSGAIADITGHGVKAAIVSNNIGSNYLLWKKTCLLRKAPTNSQGVQELIKQCIYRVNDGLEIQRDSIGCSMTMFVMDPKGNVTYSTMGQTGLVVLDKEGYYSRYLKSSGSRIGMPANDLNVAIEHTSLSDDERGFVFFSDGVVLADGDMPRLLKRAQRAAGNKEKGVIQLFGNAIRKTVKTYVSEKEKGRNIEDDITFVKINFR